MSVEPVQASQTFEPDLPQGTTFSLDPASNDAVGRDKVVGDERPSFRAPTSRTPPEPDNKDGLDILRSQFEEGLKRQLEKLSEPEEIEGASAEAATEKKPEEPPKEESRADDVAARQAPPSTEQAPPAAEVVEIDGYKIPVDHIRQAFAYIRNVEPLVRTWQELEQMVADRVEDPAWREAVTGLFGPEWQDFLVEIEEGPGSEESDQESLPWEEEGNEGAQQKPGLRVRPVERTESVTATPTQQVPPEVEETVRWVTQQRLQAANALADQWVEDFRKRYPALSDDATLRRLGEWIQQSGMFDAERGWYRPDLGNPVEIAAMADPELRRRIVEAQRENSEKNVDERSKSRVSSGIESNVDTVAAARARLLQHLGKHS